MALSARPLAAARSAARRGEVDAAVPVLAAAAESGDAAAAASLAELLAFMWRWEEVVPQAGRLVTDPFAVYAGNVFDDMVRLLGRAGWETGRWTEVAAVADRAWHAVEARLHRNDLGYHPVKVKAERNRLLTILDRLGEYAVRRGRATRHESMNFFLETRRAPNRAAYEVAREKGRGHPLSHHLALAIGFGLDDEVVRLGREIGSDLRFDEAVLVARALIGAGSAGEAWEAVASAWTKWAPVDSCQVAPCVLLTDPALGEIVTRERAGALLRRPRAPHLKLR